MRKLFALIMALGVIGIIAVHDVSAATIGDYPLLIGAYTDSTTDNTWPTDAASYPLLEDWYLEDSTASGALWGNRTSGVGIDEDVMEASSSLSTPQITMTVTGLDDTKMYDVYLVYWSKKNFETADDFFGAWGALAGEPLIMFDNENFNVDFYEQPEVEKVDGCQGLLGQVSGVTEVSVDVRGVYPAAPDVSTDLVPERGWFDGVAVVETTTTRASHTLTMNIQVDDPCNINPVIPADGEFPVTPAAGTVSVLDDMNVTLFADAEFYPCPDKFVFDHWSDGSGDDPNVVKTIRMTGNVIVTAHFTAVETVKVCGDACHPILATDLNADCIIDLRDFSMFASQWLMSTRPEDD